MSDRAFDVVPPTTRINIEAHAGDLFDLLVPILDNNDDPVAIDEGDVSSWSARATVRRNVLAGAVLHEWDSTADEPSAFIVAGEAAQVRLIATPTETALWQDWPSFTAGWDLDVTEPITGPDDPDHAPTPHRLAAGLIRVRPQFTR